MQANSEWLTANSVASPILVDVVFKATVLILVAMAVIRLLRRSSAAVRHRVWGLMFCGLLLLPVLSWGLPEWRVPILPAPSPAEAAPERVVEPISELEVNAEPESFNGTAPAAPVFELAESPDRNVVIATPPLLIHDAADELLEPTERATIAHVVDSSTESTRPARLSVAIALWLIGAILTLFPLVWCMVRNTFLWARAKSVNDAGWRELLDELRDSLGLRRRVDLMQSRRQLVPMTWGLFRPVVMLPDQARGWTARLRRFVLLHELAHVKRWDVGFQMLGRLACAVYWFHPLVWLAMRRMRIERELACDDCILNAGERPADYAEQLLQIARTCRPTGLVAAVAMAEGNSLEQRVRALLDRARSHVPLSPSLATALLLSSMVVVTGVAVFRPATMEANAATETTLSADPESNPAADPGDNGNEPDSDATIVTVRGKVVLPDGSPAVGAIIRATPPMFTMLEPLVGEDFDPPVTQVEANEQGEFSVAISRAPYGDLGQFDDRWGDTWKRTTIVASLTGYGPQWVSYDKIDDTGQPVLMQLVEDVPIQGRVIDLDGQPVAGVSVKIGGPSAAEDDDLSAWIEGARNGEVPWTIHTHAPRSVEPKLIGIPEQMTTDSDGRFTIRGVGAERLLTVVFDSETVAYRQVSVVTRRMESIQRVISTPPFEGHETVFGAEFTFTAAPSRPIVGTVRDADTGRPMPGVAVESYKLSDYPYSNHRVLKTVTDDDGQYRLIGMPKGDGNQLLVLPHDDQPYFMRQVNVTNPEGLGPATVDIEIHRGIWITGRITDKATGEPVGGARLHYLPFRSNEFAQALPEFDDNGNVHGDQMRYQSEPDGTYRLVGLPGPAIVGAESIYKQYRKGMGYEEIDGPFYRETDYLDTYRNPVNASPKWPNVIAAIDPAASVETVTLDLEMDPGLSVPIRIVGPDGEPLSNVEVTGTTSAGYVSQVTEAEFEATEFAPDETRTILFRHEQQGLGCVARISPSGAVDGPVTVELHPIGTLSARLLHEDGTPMAGLEVESRPLPSGDFAKRLPSVTTDSEGRFQLSLLPGASYSLQASGADIEQIAEITRMLTIEPGENKELGNLSLSGRKFVPAPDDITGQPANLLNLRGRVLGPDGQIRRGASVWVRGPFVTDWLRLDRTDNGGRFNVSIDRTRLDTALANNPGTRVRLAATAADYGMAWIDVRPDDLGDDITLSLSEHVPIEGRIVSLDGQPAAGVGIRVTQIPVSGMADVDAFVRSAPGSTGVYYGMSPWTLIGAGPEMAPTQTDADGSVSNQRIRP